MNRLIFAGGILIASAGLVRADVVVVKTPDRGIQPQAVFDAKGNLVKDAGQLQRGDSVRAQLGRGEFTAEVGEVNPEVASE